jgi:hypothetical protein
MAVIGVLKKLLRRGMRMETALADISGLTLYLK